MKEFFSGLILFVALAIIFSNMTGCSSSVESGNKTTGDAAKNEAANSANTESAKSDSRYPPVATAIAQSDIKNLDDTTFKVADKKGKVILLNLWATWCGPCRAEMPALVRMQEKHRDAGLEIIGLNTDDETLDQINAFVADMKLNYTIAWADTKLQAALVKLSEFGGIPQSFLIDRDGRLRGVFRGGGKAEVAKMEELVDMVVTGQATPIAPEADNAPQGSTQKESASDAKESSPIAGDEKADPKGAKPGLKEKK